MRADWANNTSTIPYNERVICEDAKNGQYLDLSAYDLASVCVCV